MSATGPSPGGFAFVTTYHVTDAVAFCVLSLPLPNFPLLIRNRAGSSYLCVAGADYSGTPGSTFKVVAAAVQNGDVLVIVNIGLGFGN